MSHFHSHLNTAKLIVEQYSGQDPLGNFLKKFFSQAKKYGSRDRKTISALCYSYYRVGNSLDSQNIEDRLLLANFACGDLPNALMQEARPILNEKATASIEEKLVLAKADPLKIFPLNEELSTGIDVLAFNLSHLVQPDLFIRIRPGKHKAVKDKLAAAKIPFKEVSNNCVALANGTKLDEVLKINIEAVVQDFNSQKTGDFISLAAEGGKSVSIWDCCAASGGKSILAYDLLGYLNITVSDIRTSIIQNLKNRLKDAQIEQYRSFVADITNSESIEHHLNNNKFNLVICDVPCSGSGTWSRTPEQLCFFNIKEINRYSNLQKMIVSNTIPFVEKGGYFLYITCSVFKKENEEVVEFIKAQFNLTPIKIELLKGYDQNADSMFAALFRVE